jgi:hypothetical protein
VVADSGGNWSLISTAAYPHGGGVNAVDLLAANNMPSSTASATYNGIRGTTPPPAPTAPTLNVSGDGDGHITASGTAVAGDTVQVKWPDGSTASVVVGSGGSWSLTSTAAYPNGGGVNAVDLSKANNMWGDAANATYNGTGTTPPPPAPAAPTLSVTGDDSSHITASGTAVAGDSVVVKWPDGSTASVLVDSGGAWSLASTQTYPNGGSVSAVDVSKANNLQGDAASATYNGDVPGPQAPAAPTLNISGDSAGHITASGTAVAGDTVVVKWPDGSTASVVVDSGGTDTVVVKWPDGSTTNVLMGSSGTWSLTSSAAYPNGGGVNAVDLSKANNMQGDPATATYNGKIGRAHV